MNAKPRQVKTMLRTFEAANAELPLYPVSARCMWGRISRGAD